MEIGEGCKLTEHDVWQEYAGFFLSLLQGFWVQASNLDFHWLRDTQVFDKPSHDVPVDIPWVFTEIASFPDVMQLSMVEAI